MGTKRKRDDSASHPSGVAPKPSNATASSPQSSTLKTAPKLPRLPPHLEISKRPLLRPPIPSKHSSAQKTVYVSTRTPFMAAAKRVISLLALADKRDVQSALDMVKKGKGGAKGRMEEDVGLNEAARMAAREKGRQDGEVLIRGTGRAIEKVLGLGVWFGQREGYGVQVRTGSVGAVDDIVEKESQEAEEDVEGEGDVLSTRIRYTSTVELAVSRA
ncbi:hypothetical protein CAC42_7501 [Sphaceloma murrayae]|uniref:Uncharacterized protein n=1 Tax=Sphaceloma murrayae TaxID=2082308 RepID=A0A2K1QX82_9PEZI|nr:hypothetical protein CAC42_7501 [Sphaceloma murrayae]